MKFGQIREDDDATGVTTVYGTCQVGAHPHEIQVPTQGLNDWLHKGLFVQAALPNTPVEDREFLISGTCGPCFDRLFRKEGF